jgi:hypothetical protein
MGAHINDKGEFQSDKYPNCPAGKVPLSTKDPMAQDLLWAYAQRRRAVDEEFAADLETCLRADGYRPALPTPEHVIVTTAMGRFVRSPTGARMSHLRLCEESLTVGADNADESGHVTFLLFDSQAGSKAYVEALRARGEALPKGTVLVP